MNRFFILLFISIYSITVFGQKVEFSKETDKYPRKLNSIFSSSGKKSQVKDLMEKFSLMWEEGQFTEDQKKKIVGISNQMLDKRAVAVPHFSNFVELLTVLISHPKGIELYDTWQSILVKMLKERKMHMRKIDAFNLQMLSLISENSFYKTPTVNWVSSTDDYEIIYKNKEVYIQFKNDIDIICYAKRDSIKIFKTKGYAQLLEGKWNGVNGKVTWERAGYEPDKVYANIRTYSINLDKSYYTADSALFINDYYFNKPILGELTDKATHIVKESQASYPRFDSYTKRYEIKNIYPSIDFDGGFRMRGSRFLGVGDTTSYAKLSFYRNDTLFLLAQTRNLVFRQNIVSGLDTKVTFYLDKDSIYHPGLNFKYLIEDSTVVLFRDGKGMSRCPYFNSYHETDMDVQEVRWKVTEPRITFSVMKGGTNKLAVFESTDYFTMDRYVMLQGIDEINPLFIIKNFVRNYGVEEFNAKDLAQVVNSSMTSLRHMLMRLSYMGFITYDFDTDEIVVKDRLHNYISSYSGTRDYDVISFESEPKDGMNASLNLLNYDLRINGVDEIHLSDSQNVTIYPTAEKIVLKKNRDFEFDGRVEAGLFTFFGKDFSFEYDKFKVNLNNVEALQLKVRTGRRDEFGRPELREVKTVIEEVNGDLLIDHPNNKSGIKPNSEYPIFNSRTDSYVYYDKRCKYRGIYKRDKFYFQVYPYTIDSLDNFTKEGIDLKGYFVSGGIFPPFEESLRLMPDYSLGFVRSTPPEGIPLYGGKGTFNSTIMLSNQGLKGDGNFEYIASTTFSDNFVFFPDSMNTHAQKALVEKWSSPVPFPEAHAEDVFARWLPYKDEYFIYEKTAPISMYEEQSILHGTMKVQPEGLSGWGKMEFTGAELTSDLFVYGENTFDADTSRFNLRGMDMDDFAFKTENVNAHIDFIERKGVFKSNGEASFVEFPRNQYICFMDQFNWYMDKEEIEMSASESALKQQDAANTADLSPTELEDIQLSGSDFISIHPQQDSLRFKAPSAKYSLRKSLITAKEVKWIRVGDATIHLDEEGIVIIERKAKMQTLENTRIVANNTDRYHTIYGATSNIYGRKDYISSGDYDYIDENKQKQTIHFDNVSLDSTIQTYATGKIGLSDGFRLSPYFDYTGQVRLTASVPNLTFKGYTRLVHECDTLKKQWVGFEAEIDPKDIYIPFYSDSTVDINNGRVHAGMYLFQDSAHVYSEFYTTKNFFSDPPILEVSGYLHYSKREGKYKISNKEKLVEPNLPGNYISIHKSICNIYAEGNINIVKSLGQIQTRSVGNIMNDLFDNSYDFDIMLGLNFFFNDKCLDMVSKTLEESSALDGVDLTRKTYRKGLVELVGMEMADKLMAELALGSFKKIPKELQYTIFINQLHLVWDSDKNAFISEGPIGIGSIGKDQINRLVDGHIEIERKRSGDRLKMYFDVGGTWFYFEYMQGLFNTASNLEGYETLIKEMKADDRKMEVEKGEPSFIYYVASKNKVKRWLKQYETEDEEEEGSDE